MFNDGFIVSYLCLLKILLDVGLNHFNPQDLYTKKV